MGISNDASHSSRLRQVELPLILSSDLRIRHINVLQQDITVFYCLGISLDCDLFLCFAFACKGDWSAWWGSVLDLSTKCVETLKLELALVTTDFIVDVLIVIVPIPKVMNQLSSLRYSS